MGKLLTPKETAKIFGVTTTALRQWVKKGKLKATMTPGGQRRYDVDDINKLKECSINAESE
jgi:excisionase family DNA binding protein